MTKLINTAAAVLLLSTTGVFAQGEPLTEAHLAMVDFDGDGNVSLTEYRVYTSNAFIALDTDADNALTPAEGEKAIPENLFSEMDKDADGIVSRAEYDTQTLLDFHHADTDGDGQLN